jgi:glycyl-tRNA synthetase beta subunit
LHSDRRRFTEPERISARPLGAPRQIDTESEHAVIDEVTNLVEDPVAILGSFDASYLTCPVMADDPAVKANRLGLLASVYRLAEGHLDWGQLP